MRKLKLQMQISINGFVGGPNGELDWMKGEWDEALRNYLIRLHENVDTILLGRKLAEIFIPHWAKAAKDTADEDYIYAKQMAKRHKVVFSKTLNSSPWENTVIEKDLVEGVTKLKEQAGEDMIVYGGAGFVSELIRHDLIDELHLLVDPTTIAEGMTIFRDKKIFQHVKSTSFSCGTVVIEYMPSGK